MPFDKQELILLGGIDDVCAGGPSILLRACDVSEANFKESADFAAKRLSARGDSSSSEHGRQRRLENVVASMTLVATTFSSVGRNTFAGASTTTSVVSSANAPLMPFDEATSGEQSDDAQMQQDFRSPVRKHGKRLVVKLCAQREASRMQLEQEEKRVTSRNVHDRLLRT